jgi:hypothetical protein
MVGVEPHTVNQYVLETSLAGLPKPSNGPLQCKSSLQYQALLFPQKLDADDGEDLEMDQDGDGVLRSTDRT